MKKTTTILFILGNVLLLQSQEDTVAVNTKTAALTYKKCKQYLFGFWRRMSSPTLESWTKTDSAFINNTDTIYFRIIHNGNLRFEGHKLPKAEAIGEIKFYDSKSNLYRIEYWSDAIGSVHGLETASWSETPTWQIRQKIKNGQVVKDYLRSVEFNNNKGWVKKTRILKFKNDEFISTRVRIRKY